MRKKCLQYLLHKGSPGVQLIIAIRGKKKLLTNIDNIKFICYMAFRLYFLLDLRKNITKEGDPYENIFIGG